MNKGILSVVAIMLTTAALSFQNNFNVVYGQAGNTPKNNATTKTAKSVTVKPKTKIPVIRNTSRGGINTLMQMQKQVKLFDWWTETSKIFVRGKTAVVKDVYTGKTFKIMRTTGTNHADCEALTMADTQVIKSIWGGFSWERRPVIVILNGYYLAASMAGMPHAGLDDKPALATVDNRSDGYGTGLNYDFIKDNGMDGHFDIHFLNSTRHLDGKVDEKHQQAIMKAYELSQ